ncbi:peptidase S8/S53 domain-containing protein, partial [Syncephalis fuscata]
DLVAINELTGVSALHAEGNYGEGVKVGIVDSGIDYKHPALGGCFGDGCKVRYGHDFVNDDFPGKNKAMKSDPIDCSGHGTQVAGIIGAETDTFVGVAYKALLGAYRVMGCDRKAHIDIMMQGIKM